MLRIEPYSLVIGLQERHCFRFSAGGEVKGGGSLVDEHHGFVSSITDCVWAASAPLLLEEQGRWFVFFTGCGLPAESQQHLAVVDDHSPFLFCTGIGEREVFWANRLRKLDQRLPLDELDQRENTEGWL